MTEVLILPGMDGTGALHDGVCEELRKLGVEARSLSYPFDTFLSYAELADFATPLLPQDRPFILLGESFSGPVAITIAVARPKHLVGLVLSTTFACSPVSLIAPLAPLTRFGPARLPSRLVSWFLLGRWATASLIRAVQASLSMVSPDVVRSRAAAALRVDVSDLLPRISIPVLQIRARNDRLLSVSAQNRLANGLGNSQTVDIMGPHLILQAQPQVSARVIAQFVRGVGV
jgi:pimeloyl-ACP methyl ester carboxylesterase